MDLVRVMLESDSSSLTGVTDSRMMGVQIVGCGLAGSHGPSPGYMPLAGKSWPDSVPVGHNQFMSGRSEYCLYQEFTHQSAHFSG